MTAFIAVLQDEVRLSRFMIARYESGLLQTGFRNAGGRFVDTSTGDFQSWQLSLSTTEDLIAVLSALD